ncbi:MAG: Uncharacterized protein G01um10147_230 [Microgenomates group bacterium Gr01-1014_7]|nr:MAG: Uncharacterized protein G01um10147_230 [Microgenomates group bacterium Gr01-1014_7]
MRGFAPIVAIIIIAGVLIGGVFWWQSGSKQENEDFPSSNNSKARVSAADWPALWGSPDQKCQDKKDIKFSALPIKASDIIVIEPMGELREGHIVPGDHIGIEYKTSPSSSPVDVFAPADGTIVTVERHAYTPPAGYPQNIRHYHFYIVHSCTLFSGFVHLTEFAQDILAVSADLKKLNDENVSEYKNAYVNIPVKAGQKIGTAWTFGLLGAVTVDLNYTNKGYLNAVSYKGENWRPHSVSLFEYLDEPLKSAVYTKNPRKAEPRGGKIDFDVDGKIVGSWFEEGTGGFRSENFKPKLCGNFPCPYWDGHVALVYDFIDPGQLRVSIGHDWGLSGRTPFGVKDGVNFKDIGVGSGLTKYELVGLKDVTKGKGFESSSALITENDETLVLGTMLVQLLENQNMKLEIFPGKTKEQVSEFTSQARVYTR